MEGGVAREWRRPPPSPSRKNGHPSGNQTQEDYRNRCSIREGDEGHRGDGGTRTVKPLEAVRDLGAGRGWQRGGKLTRKEGRCRHAARGADSHRDKRQRLTGDECGQRSGVRRSTPGEELGIG